MNVLDPPIFLLLAASDELSWSGVVAWVAVAGVIVTILAAAGSLHADVLQRGPLREIDFSTADVFIGFGFVGLIFLDQLMIGLGGRVVNWPAAVEQGVRQIAALALVAGSVYFFGKAWLTDAGLRKAGFVPRRPVRDLVYTVFGTPVAVILTFATLVAVNGVATAAGYPSPEVNHGMLEQLKTAELQMVIAIIVTAVVVGPLLEEIVFRGLLQTLLLEVFGRKARWTAIVIASAVFASVHLGATTWHALPGLFVLGVALGWIYERTGSLLPVYLIHAVFNGLNIAMVLSGVGAESG
ncbi:MAG: CPBP family intramembrane glutamic endopeptidase [Planctomycetota bacterium]